MESKQYLGAPKNRGALLPCIKTPLLKVQKHMVFKYAENAWDFLASQPGQTKVVYDNPDNNTTIHILLGKCRLAEHLSTS